MTTSSVPGYPDLELVFDDGEPMESIWHVDQMHLLIELTHTLWTDRQDVCVGGNNFIYFSAAQARNRDYRGPDYFAVKGVDGSKKRKGWVVWEDGGRFPDIIVELLSPSTRDEDLGTKKDLYESTFRTSEYFCVDPESWTIRGWRLMGSRYEPLLPGEGGRLESRVLGATLGLTTSIYRRREDTYARLWTPAGELVPTDRELNDATQQRAAAVQQRAEAMQQHAAAVQQRAAAVQQHAEAMQQHAEAMQQRAEAETRGARLTASAARIIALYARRGARAAVEEVRRTGGADPARLLAAIEEIDAEIAAEIAAALRSDA